MSNSYIAFSPTTWAKSFSALIICPHISDTNGNSRSTFSKEIIKDELFESEGPALLPVHPGIPWSHCVSTGAHDPAGWHLPSSSRGCPLYQARHSTTKTKCRRLDYGRYHTHKILIILSLVAFRRGY